MINDTVVYFHKRKDTGEVFYVGIGDNKRPYNKHNRNRYWHNIVKKVGYTIEIIYTDLTWDEACKSEKGYIKYYGRKDLGLGNLANLTDGGEGNIGRIVSDESRKKVSISNTGKKRTKEVKTLLSKLAQKKVGELNPFYNKEHTTETKNIISDNNKGSGNGRAKLTEKDILDIRKRYKEGHIIQKKLAEEYNVKNNTMSNIINRVSWKHI